MYGKLVVTIIDLCMYMYMYLHLDTYMYVQLLFIAVLGWNFRKCVYDRKCL